MKTNIFSILTFFCVAALIGISGSEAFGQDVNLALQANNPKVVATQSSMNEWRGNDNSGASFVKVGGSAAKAIDGNTKGSLWDEKIVETVDNDGWFEVDLGDYYSISKIVIHPRTDNCCTENFKPILIVSDQPINKPMTDEDRKSVRQSAEAITDNKFGTPMTDDARIAASSTFYKYFTDAIKSERSVMLTDKDGKETPQVGRYVRLQMKGWGGNTRIELAELEIFGKKESVAGYMPDAGKAWTVATTTADAASGAISSVAANSNVTASGAIDPRNLARKSGVTAKQSSVNIYKLDSGKEVPAGPAERAIDGNTKGYFWEGGIVETKDDKDAWFEVDLKDYYKIDKIRIHPRSDCCRQNLFNSTYVIVTDQPIGDKPMLDDTRIFRSSTFSTYINPLYVKTEKEDPTIKEIDTKGSVGRYVRLQIKGFGAIEMTEIEIIGDPAPVAGYKTNDNRKWDAVFKDPFDPNYPNFRNAEGEFLGTLKVSPKIIGIKNSATSFDVAYQDLYGDGKQIKVNTYTKDGSNIKKDATKSTSLTGLGVFGGFTKDTAGNRYIFTGAPWKNRGDEGESLVYKNSDVLWNGKFYQNNTNPGRVKSFLHQGGSRLVTAGNSLLITSNFTDTHSYQVILDIQDKSKNTDRAFYESQYQHNTGQRAIFDGKDFVIMENRDHDVTVTLTKLNPTDVLPLKNYPAGIFSVYSHANFANNTYTDLGNVEKGLDNGYLVLFASEQDSNYKLKDYISAGYVDDKGKSQTTSAAPYILSPRNIGLVHVKNNFNAGETNWLDNKQLVQCPSIVDNSNIINSSGETKTVAYKFKNDGWDWKTYGCEPGKTCVCRDKSKEGEADRTLVNKGVKWLTAFGRESGKEFTSVNRPKLVRISDGKYVVLWEEWKAEVGQSEKSYVTTRAASLILSNNNGNVDIQVTSAKDLGKVRLMAGDDAFEFDGKAAWAVGDAVKGKLAFYTVGEDLKLSSYELEL